MELNEKEIEAIEEVVNYLEADEYQHCWSELIAEHGVGSKPEDWEDGSHIYYKIITLKALLLKLGRI